MWVSLVLQNYQALNFLDKIQDAITSLETHKWKLLESFLNANTPNVQMISPTFKDFNRNIIKYFHCHLE